MTGMRIDAVIMNPPYSLRYSGDVSFTFDPRFVGYPLAPKSKADYMFLLDALHRLDNNGRMAILFPHGVLFRGGAEEDIRKRLLDDGHVDTIIGLPGNLFAATGIPTVLMILRKDKLDHTVYIVDASHGFEKVKAQNILRPDDVGKILAACRHRSDIERYARKVTLEEIRENDYNLNIPRYVDTSEPKEPIDFVKLTQEIKDLDDEIAKTTKDLLGMMGQLTASDDHNLKRLASWIEALAYVGNADNYQPEEKEPVKEMMDKETQLPTLEGQQLTIDMFMNTQAREEQTGRRVEQLQELKKDLLDGMFI